MIIRKYRAASDKCAVMTLLKRNTPAFFDPSEQQDLEEYLDCKVEDYYVIEESGRTLGAGGINYFWNERTARISWDIIDPDAQGKGVGTKLLSHRIKLLGKMINITRIVVRTSQLVYPFYAKAGFQLVNVEKDYWARDYDLYHMELTNRPGKMS